MYVVAQVDEAICSSTSCSLCVQFCPEANTIIWDATKGKGLAIIVDARCKGCAVCEVVCNEMAKKHAIKMVQRASLTAEDGRPQTVAAVLQAQKARKENGKDGAAKTAPAPVSTEPVTLAPATTPTT